MRARRDDARQERRYGWIVEIAVHVKNRFGRDAGLLADQVDELFGVAIVNVHFALLLVQGTKTKDGEKLRFLVELHSVTLSLLFIGEMNGKRWNKAQSFMEIEYLGFNAAFFLALLKSLRLHFPTIRRPARERSRSAHV